MTQTKQQEAEQMSKRILQRQTTGHEDWGTPVHILDAARMALGGEFDLDPASNPKANERVRAAKIYTRHDDGLIWPWHAERLWLNPPFSRGLVDKFVDKLLIEWHAGNVEQACVITNNSTETRWAQMLAQAASGVCFLNGRVQFHLMDAETGEYVPNDKGNMTGQVVWYVEQPGYDLVDRFGMAFSGLGQCFWR